MGVRSSKPAPGATAAACTRKGKGAGHGTAYDVEEKNVALAGIHRVYHIKGFLRGKDRAATAHGKGCDGHNSSKRMVAPPAYEEEEAPSDDAAVDAADTYAEDQPPDDGAVDAADMPSRKVVNTAYGAAVELVTTTRSVPTRSMPDKAPRPSASARMLEMRPKSPPRPPTLTRTPKAAGKPMCGDSCVGAPWRKRKADDAGVDTRWDSKLGLE